MRTFFSPHWVKQRIVSIEQLGLIVRSSRLFPHGRSSSSNYHQNHSKHLEVRTSDVRPPIDRLTVRLGQIQSLPEKSSSQGIDGRFAFALLLSAPRELAQTAYYLATKRFASSCSLVPL